MVSCKVSAIKKINPDDVIDVRILDEEPTATSVVQYASPGMDSEDIDNSLTPFERISQKMLDALREAVVLDPTGMMRTVAVVVTTDKGKTWNITADSTEEDVYNGQEIWSKVYVESEVVKTKQAYQKRSPV